MKRSMLLSIILLLSSVCYSQMASDIQETITAKEKEMYEAIKTGDLQTFEANLSDNFMTVYPTGMNNREQELEDIKNLKMDSYELSDVQVMQPAEGVAIIAYALTASGMWNEEEEFSGQYYASSTWVMTDNEWRAVMHTETQAEQMEETVGMQN